MSRHFTATILLDEPWPLDVDALADAVRGAFPQIGRVEAVPGQSASRESGLLRIDGGHVVVTSEQSRCPAGDLSPKLKTMRTWDSEPMVRDHRAHLTVSCGGTLQGLEGAIAYAAAVHFVTAAVLDLVPARAVLWHKGYVLSEPAAFRDAGEGLLEGRLPLDCWVGHASVVPRGYVAESALGMVSYGLRAFLGRELELAPRPCAPKDAHAWITEIARRAMVQGLVLADGQRLIDPDLGYDLTVRERNFWLRRDHSAFVLVAGDAVVDVESLRPRQRSAA